MPDQAPRTISQADWKAIPKDQKAGEPGKGTARLLENGELIPVTVEGKGPNQKQGFLWKTYPIPD